MENHGNFLENSWKIMENSWKNHGKFGVRHGKSPVLTMVKPKSSTTSDWITRENMGKPTSDL
jgi:hypothetical protein